MSLIRIIFVFALTTAGFSAFADGEQRGQCPVEPMGRIGELADQAAQDLRAQNYFDVDRKLARIQRIARNCPSQDNGGDLNCTGEVINANGDTIYADPNGYSYVGGLNTGASLNLMSTAVTFWQNSTIPLIHVEVLSNPGRSGVLVGTYGWVELRKSNLNGRCGLPAL